MPRRSFLEGASSSATFTDFLAARPAGAEEDVHMIPGLVDEMVENLSAPGDLVFDPFAGFGTTLLRAVALGRRGLGIELLPDRVAHIRERCPAARIIEGDARKLVPQLTRLHGHVALSLSSPPYMTATHHDEDPLTAYESLDGDYQRYLHELGLIAAEHAHLLKPGGYLVWNVADIFHQGHHTRLIDDCASLLDAHLHRLAIRDIEWDQLPHDLTRDALLVFQRRR